MAITGVFTPFSPEVAECFDEAFELSSLAPSSIGQTHIESALRSTKFMLNSEWHNLGIRQWMITRYTQTLTAGTASFDLPAGGIDIHSAVITYAGRDITLGRLSRQDYLALYNKDLQGRPNQFTVERLYDRTTVTLWMVPDSSSDSLTIDYFRQMSTPGSLSNTLQMPPAFFDAFVHGLAARLALKFNMERYATLQALYNGGDETRPRGKLGAAITEDRDRSDLTLTISTR